MSIKCDVGSARPSEVASGWLILFFGTYIIYVVDKALYSSTIMNLMIMI